MAKKSIKQFDEKNDERVYVSVRETLESARGKVERAVNSAMVEAYWEVGRQIVEATGERAEYGKHLVRYLAERLRGSRRETSIRCSSSIWRFQKCTHCVHN